MRLTLAGAGTQPCLDEVEIFGADPKINLALASAGAKATASSCLSGRAIHRIRHLNDGKYGNSHSWIAASEDVEWVQIELSQPVEVGTVVVSRDRTGHFTDRIAGHIRVETSVDGDTFVTVAQVGSVAAARNTPRGTQRRTTPGAGGPLPSAAAVTEGRPAPPPRLTSTPAAADPTFAGVAFDALQVDFEPVDARFVRLGLPSGGASQIDEVQLFGPTGEGNLALSSRGCTAVASSHHGQEPPRQAASKAQEAAPAATAKPAADPLAALDALLDDVSTDQMLPSFSAADVPARSPGAAKPPAPREAGLVASPYHVSYLNDGRFGARSSWMPSAASRVHWVELALPEVTTVGRVVVSSDRVAARSLIRATDVYVSADGRKWRHVGTARSPWGSPSPSVQGLGADVCRAFAAELRRKRSSNPAEGILTKYRAMIERFAGRGLDVAAERDALCDLERQLAAFDPATALPGDAWGLVVRARAAKRALMFRDPDMAPLARLLLVKRHPYVPSHNYSDFMDGRLRGGGGVYVLDIPREGGRLRPEAAKLRELFDAGAGIARDVTPDWEAETVWFAYMRNPAGGYRNSGTDRKGRGAAEVPDARRWLLYRVPANGGEARQMTFGPHHDYYPCVLPDGDIAFITTRCNMRFLCWVPTTMTLYRMRPDGTGIRAISHNNLSEWFPTVRRDGRIMWTRSEYQDKGADYGHTIWAIRPDGSHSEVIYGNDTPHNIMNAMEVPGKDNELLATKISHFGDFNGPLCYIDLSKGPFDPSAMRQIPGCQSGTSNGGIYRDPWPFAKNLLLCSHKDGAHFSIYVLDRWGNRELLYHDPAISCMTPVPLQPRKRPPAIPAFHGDGPATMLVVDVYDGLGPKVEPGRVKWLRICRELPARLETYEDGNRKETYRDFRKYYAAPNDKVTGPSGWPTYVAKSVVGVVPVETDGSAHFTVPTGVMFYFQALDADFNEVQRMRSVIQAQPGESRTCLGCHDDRLRTGMPPRRVMAMARPPSEPAPEPWGSGPFWYEKVVQPVLDRRCVSCHRGSPSRSPLPPPKKIKGPSLATLSLDCEEDSTGIGNLLAPRPAKPKPAVRRTVAGPSRIDLSSTIDRVSRSPASYRTLVKYVHFFNMQWGQRHTKAQPLTFGTVRSRLFDILAGKTHEKVELTTDELRAIKCWIDLNCPLWGDYQHRDLRASGCTLCTASASVSRD